MSLKKKVSCNISLFLSLILLVCGCGIRNGEGEAVSTGQPGEQEQLEEYDLAAEEWRGFEEIEETDSYWTITEYFDDFGKVPEQDLLRYEGFSATEKDSYYRIQSYIKGTDSSQYVYYLHSVNTSTLDVNRVKLNLEGAGELLEDRERQNEYLIGIDVSNGKLYSFFAIWDREEQNYTHYYAIRFNQDGTAEQMLDLMPAIQEDSKILTSGSRFPTSTVYDPDGYYYLIDGVNREILVVDANGNRIDMIAFQDCMEMSIAATCKTPDGSPIFEYTDSNGHRVIFSLEGTTKKILFSGQTAQVKLRNADPYGNVIYFDNRRLLRWNAARGQCRCICDASGLNSVDCSAILESTDGELVLVFESQNESYLYKIKSVPDFEPRELVLLQWYSDEYTKNCAAEYSRKHPGIVITVTEPGDQSDVSFVRMVEDIQAGNGPDMMVVWRELLVDMEKAGVLADLDGILSREVQDQIFAGVLQYGTIGETIYGLPVEASAETLLVSEAVWSGDTWTVQDMIELMAKNPAATRCISISSSLTANQMLYDLCVKNLAASSFVDLQNHTSSFDTEKFCSLLEFCKEYGEAQGSGKYMTDSEKRDEVLDGRAISYEMSGGLIQFSRARSMFDESFHCVGFPTNGENGSVVVCYSCIAVNQYTENLDIIKDFIQFLMSEESQAAYTTNWVRRDVLLDHVRDGDGKSNGPVFQINDRAVIPLEGRPDGTSYLDEYLILMEEGVTLNTEYEIQNFILEEAAAYFAGDKSVQETASVIQNRVQLYLDEQN